MYYYGARYYDPKMSLFVSVDPLAEQFREWSPYNYTMNNPINLIDPTGMAPEDTDPPGGKKGKQDKILNVKYKGEDKSIYANDLGLLSGIYHGAKIINKYLRKQSEKLLSGGFHFFDDDTGAKGDMTLKKRPMEGQKVETINVSGIMQAGSFAKGGEGLKYDGKEDFPIRFYNAVYSAYQSGAALPDAKVTIPNNINTYESYYNEKGFIDYRIKSRIEADTTFELKHLPKVINKAINRESRKQYESRFQLPAKR